jgi:hypothetical protein
MMMMMMMMMMMVVVTQGWWRWWYIYFYSNEFYHYNFLRHFIVDQLVVLMIMKEWRYSRWSLPSIYGWNQFIQDQWHGHVYVHYHTTTW